MRKILVVYYSSYGHIEAMAYAQAEGAAKVPGTEVVVKRVAELAPPDVCKNAGFKLEQAAPLATVTAMVARRKRNPPRSKRSCPSPRRPWKARSTRCSPTTSATACPRSTARR